MTVSRTPINGGLSAFEQRLDRYPDRAAEIMARQMARFALTLVPRRTGFLASTIGVERVVRGRWVCFAAAEYALPVEVGHRIFNQFGGSYGWVPPQPYMRPAFETVIAQAGTLMRRAVTETT